MHPTLPTLLLALAQVPDGSAAEFARVLHSVDLGVDEEQRAAFARELAGLADAVELHLTASVSGHFPGDAQAALGAEHWALLERAADELDRDEVAAAVERGLEQGCEAAWGLAALDLLARRGEARDLRLMVELHDGGGLGEGAHDELGAAALRLFEREPAALSALEALAVLSDRATLELMNVVSRSAGAEGVPWLLDQLRDDDLADAALQALGRVTPAVPIDRAPELADRLRPWLEVDAPQTRRLAVRALVGLQDERAIPRLVELLGSEASGEASEAARALRKLTGRDLAADATTWRGWLSEELAWWGERSQPALEELWSEDLPVAMTAVSEIARRGLLRDRLSIELARALREHPLPEVRERACRGLAQLRSRAACPELLVALDSPDGEVQELAWRALQAVTGLPHPPEPRLWHAALAL